LYSNLFGTALTINRPFTEKKCNHNFLHEIDGWMLGVALAGEEASIASDLIKQANQDSFPVMIP
jgi:hypothetical protein